MTSWILYVPEHYESLEYFGYLSALTIFSKSSILNV